MELGVPRSRTKPLEEECRRTVAVVDRGRHPQEFAKFTLDEFGVEISHEHPAPSRVPVASREARAAIDRACRASECTGQSREAWPGQSRNGCGRGCQPQASGSE